MTFDKLLQRTAKRWKETQYWKDVEYAKDADKPVANEFDNVNEFLITERKTATENNAYGDVGSAHQQHCFCVKRLTVVQSKLLDQLVDFDVYPRFHTTMAEAELLQRQKVFLVFVPKCGVVVC